MEGADERERQDETSQQHGQPLDLAQVGHDGRNQALVRGEHLEPQVSERLIGRGAIDASCPGQHDLMELGSFDPSEGLGSVDGEGDPRVMVEVALGEEDLSYDAEPRAALGRRSGRGRQGGLLPVRIR